MFLVKVDLKCAHYYKIKRICFTSIDGVNSLTIFGPNLAILIWADKVQLSRADSDPRAEVVITTTLIIIIIFI